MKRPLNTNDYAKLNIQDLLNVVSDDFHKGMKETFATVNLQLETAYQLEPREEELEFACAVLKKMDEKFIEYTEKEEQLLFPVISVPKQKQKELVDIEISEFISGLKSEHDWFRRQIRLIRKITNRYSCDPSFTPSHKLAYAQLNDLEQDFNRLFFVEEEYLFPRALRIHQK